MQSTSIFTTGRYGRLDVFGPTIEFLTSPREETAPYCMMIGTIPAGVSVPLHSHLDLESFYVLSGAVEVLSERENGFEWLQAKTGDFIHVPSGALHGFRNNTDEPVVELTATTPRLARFFEEVGRPVQPGVTLPAPTSEEIQHFMRVAARYNHWLGSPEENAAVGISLF